MRLRQRKMVLWDTHPVQYRAPLYAEIDRYAPDSFEVVYESDSSVRGYHDEQFGREVAWDMPLVEGYNSIVLSEMKGRGWLRAFAGRFLQIAWDVVSDRPRVSFHVQFNTPATAAAYCAATMLGLEMWMRVETQDEAFSRSPSKSLLRSFVWRMIYAPITRAFYIGNLNHQHLLRHGFRPALLEPARYLVVEGVSSWSLERKQSSREQLRAQFKIPSQALVVGFCGKLIPKKDPALLLNARRIVERELGHPCYLLLIGSGQLEEALRAEACIDGDRVHFAGFINQQSLPAYYLAMDVFVLPSRREGETWGLVVNEALQAGCSVVMSSAVGASADFGRWPRCRVFQSGQVADCASAIIELAGESRDFLWCTEPMEPYSLPTVAQAMAAWFGAAKHQTVI